MSGEILKSLGENLNRDMVTDLLENGFYIENFDFLLKHMMEDVKPTSWRSAWVVGHLMDENDTRVKKILPKIIKSIKGKNDGHQRELIRIVRRMKLSEREEGYFFDICVTLWEEIHKKPATRYNAVLFIIETAKKHPEIKNELEHLTSDYYTQTLSQGIKRIFNRELEILRKL